MLARNHAQQMPIAINAALGAAMVVAALSITTRHLDVIMRLRTAVLWIPLVMGYWMTVGLRASFFVPSELPASWAFRANAPDSVKAHWLAVRASMIAFLVPRTLIIAALLAPFLGWRVAATNGLIASGLVILLVEAAVLTIDFIPFTRAYQPGHAKLKTRWWVYAIGLYVFAYWPARVELWALKRPSSLLGMLACIMGPIAILELMGRRGAGNRSLHFNEEDEDDSTGATVLHLSGFRQGAQSGR